MQAEQLHLPTQQAFPQPASGGPNQQLTMQQQLPAQPYGLQGAGLPAHSSYGSQPEPETNDQFLQRLSAAIQEKQQRQRHEVRSLTSYRWQVTKDQHTGCVDSFMTMLT